MRMRAAMAVLPVAVVLAASALVGRAAPILAQTAAASQPDWDRETDQVLTAVKAQYGLTDDQVGKIRPLLRAHLSSMRALFDSYVGKNIDAAPAILKQYQQQREDFKAKVDPILTEPQRRDFMKIRAEFDAQMRKAFIDARMQWFERVVGVDAAQADKVRPIVTESFERRLQILSGSPEEKDPAEAQKAARIQLQILQGETDAKLKTVLTPEQMGKYQASAGTGAPAEPQKPATR
jgi:Spy/CpxP family protein refolding chaperone